MYKPSNEQAPIRNLLNDAGKILLNSNAQITAITINKTNKTSIESIRGIKSFMDTSIHSPHFLYM